MASRTVRNTAVLSMIGATALGLMASIESPPARAQEPTAAASMAAPSATPGAPASETGNSIRKRVADSAENGSTPAALHQPGAASKKKKSTARSDGEASKNIASGDSKNGSGQPATPFSALQFSSGHGPIDISADALDLDYKKNTVDFRGHVHAAQADAQLTSETLKVIYGKDFHEVKQMFADGDVRMSQGTRWATGDHAVLDQSMHTVVLTGSPVVHDGEDQVTGNRITVHLDTGKSEVEGARAVFFPKEQKTRDNKATPAKAS
jgi:lipopolysaccharide export system protein LptA